MDGDDGLLVVALTGAAAWRNLDAQDGYKLKPLLEGSLA